MIKGYAVKDDDGDVYIHTIRDTEAAAIADWTAPNAWYEKYVPKGWSIVTVGILTFDD